MSAPSIRERIQTFPKTPGVYLMKDKQGHVVYVGKATNIRARLRSYFARSGDERFFVRLLDEVLGDIELVLTKTAKEALLVEDQLIKAHQPRFNVKLKDDKSFLNLRLGHEHAWPRLEVVRKRKKDGARYFGPYASASAIRQTLRLVNRHFQLRTCANSEFNNRSRPCLEHQIDRCPAPCVLEVPTAEYAESLRRVTLFLSGRTDELAQSLKEQMALAAEEMAFERAAQLRDQLKAVARSLEAQDVVTRKLTDLDVFGVARQGPHCCVHVQRVREGRLCFARAFKMKNEAPDEVLLSQFLTRWYGRGEELPPELLLAVPVEDPELVQDWLSDKRGTKVRLFVPRRGERRRLVEGANRNAQSALELDRDRGQRQKEILLELKRRLHLRRFPERIECYDISNVSGTDPVASMVVFTDGEPDKAEYRRFHIRSQDTPDDFLMMYEALTRRFQRVKSGAWVAPDLVVIDGGKGQLGMAVRVLRELAVEGVAVISLAKSRVQNDNPNEDITRSPERVFLPGIKDPVVLRQNSAPLYLLTRLRDEAHRFAITFHRQTRRKKRLGSSLDAIPGIGPARRRALLTRFGSLAAVTAASADDLANTPGISAALAGQIRDALDSGEA